MYAQDVSTPFSHADSARAQPGYRIAPAAARYATPGMCLAAVQALSEMIVRDPYLDTLAAWQQPDTLPTAARTWGVQCASAFSAAAVPVRELPNFVTLSLLLEQPAPAAAAVERWVTAATAPGARAWSLVQAIHRYLSPQLPMRDQPANARAAQELLARLNALGSWARAQQLAAAVDLYQQTYVAAVRRGEWPAHDVLRDGLTLLTQLDHATGDERAESGTGSWMALALLHAKAFVDPEHMTSFIDSLRTSPTFASVMRSPDVATAMQEWSRIGTPAPTLADTAWYEGPTIGNVAPRPAPATSDTHRWPRPGLVSLLVPVSAQRPNYAQWWMIRRLAATYAARGLAIVGVTKTAGWMPHDGLILPAQEMTADSAYFLGYLTLPMSLVVEHTVFTRRADGRVVQPAPVGVEAAYGTQALVLTDRQGKIILMDNIADVTEARLRAYLERALDH